jgi:tetratricopeptide (TPR) repeat protein
LALGAYNKALATGYTKQEGIILLLRATAHLKQAEVHKVELETTVDELADMVPNSETVKAVLFEAIGNAALARSVLPKMLQQGKSQEAQFRKTQYRHGLYQYALLHAAQDALRATELLESYPTSWLRAGEILAELWKLDESRQYYERAMALDPSLQGSLEPVMDRLAKRQELVEKARANGWPEDTLRLALDVAG